MKEWEEFNIFFRYYCIDSLKKKLKGLGSIYDVCVYMFQLSGKFLRPFLLYKVAEFINPSKRDCVLPFALSLELIHNYSLIHDDLPCMDNADFRRGYPTVHKKFGEAEAVLAGDMLLSLAFEYASESRDFEPNKILRVIKKISQYSSYRYLITGQFFDIWIQNGKMEKNVENIKITNFYKTAGLILLSVEIPIILLDPVYTVKYNLIKYGYFLGLLFQLTDDILDNDGLAFVLDRAELKKVIDRLYGKLNSLNVSEELLNIANVIYNRV
ncbi:MAG: polyprenyl synthetase family protein [Candidatus Calescibacterium sp.]|nr:polyprenyl synthetase family protein [Candidatus Calescibacterium sp.]MDW8132751.1 polyprenyl synthetase family protein [Candidatus Calescibacterium sp.]